MTRTDISCPEPAVHTSASIALLIAKILSALLKVHDNSVPQPVDVRVGLVDKSSSTAFIWFAKLFGIVLVAICCMALGMLNVINRTGHLGGSNRCRSISTVVEHKPPSGISVCIGINMPS